MTTPTNNNTETAKKQWLQLPTNATNSERMVAEYNAFKPTLETYFNAALDEYGLAARLAEAKAAGHKLKILSFQCCEGLYLHLFSGILEKRGLLEGAELYGLDSDAVLLGSAEELSKVSKPPRPYLQFYRQDLTQPLETNFDLSLLLNKQGQILFEFIFAHYGLSCVPDAKTIFQRLYTTNLAPGGILYLRDVAYNPDEQGSFPPHPAFQEFVDITKMVLNSFNPSEVVAKVKVGWLEELGATNIRNTQDAIPWGGPTTRGQGALQNLIIIVLKHGPLFIEAGIWTNEQHHNLVHFIYNQLTLDDIGCWSFMDSLCTKPA